MRLVNSTAATIAGYLLVLTTALAQQAVDDRLRSTIDSTFSELDVNHDGTISNDEAAEIRGLSERFATFDVNKDGKLDKSEFTKAMGG